MRGAVLAGGHASRFGGRPKGLERVAGERILDRVIQVVREAVGRPPTLIAGPEAQAWRPDIAIVPDIMPQCGSLGGVYTALMSGDGPVLLAAWDMPFLSAALLRALIAGASQFDVFLPESEGPRGLEPLCGVYSPACRTPIRELLEAEDYRMTGFHEHVRVGTLGRERVAAFGDPATLFFNVNTPQELARAEELARA